MRSLPRTSQGSSNATTLMMCSFNKTASITASVSFLYSTKCNQIFSFIILYKKRILKILQYLLV